MSSSFATAPSLPTYDDVVRAHERIARHAHRTPVLTSRITDAELGPSAYFKCENLQRMGAFKFRGAFNALSRFDGAQRRAGVVAYSSGNHAQAVALSAALLGIPATIVMPHDAPAAKLAATRGYGAQVVPYDRWSEDREEIGAALARERGLTLVPPYDHPDVIAGQGTAAWNCSRTPARSTRCSCRSAAAASCRARLSPPRARARLRGLRGRARGRRRRPPVAARGRIVHIDTPDTLADGAQTQHLGTRPSRSSGAT